MAQRETLLEMLGRLRGDGSSGAHRSLAGSVGPRRPTTGAAQPEAASGPSGRTSRRAPDDYGAMFDVWLPDATPADPTGSRTRRTHPETLAATATVAVPHRADDAFDSIQAVSEPLLPPAHGSTRTGLRTPAELARERATTLLDDSSDAAVFNHGAFRLQPVPVPDRRATEAAIDALFGRMSRTSAADAAASANAPAATGAGRRSSGPDLIERMSTAALPPTGEVQRGSAGRRSILELESANGNSAGRPSDASARRSAASNASGGPAAFERLLHVPGGDDSTTPNSKRAQRESRGTFEDLFKAPAPPADDTTPSRGTHRPGTGGGSGGRGGPGAGRMSAAVHDRHGHPLADDALHALESAYDVWTRRGQPPSLAATVLGHRVRLGVALLHCRVDAVARPGEVGCHPRVASLFHAGDECGVVVTAALWRSIGARSGGQIILGSPVAITPVNQAPAIRGPRPAPMLVIWAGASIAVAPTDNANAGPFRYAPLQQPGGTLAGGAKAGDGFAHGRDASDAGGDTSAAETRASSVAPAALWPKLGGFYVGPAEELGWSIDVQELRRVVAMRTAFRATPPLPSRQRQPQLLLPQQPQQPNAAQQATAAPYADDDDSLEDVE